MSESAGGLSHGAYARRKGWSQQYVSRQVKAGKIPVGADGKIDPELADAVLAANADPGKLAVVAANAAWRAASREPVPELPKNESTDDAEEGETYIEAKLRDARAAADLREMEAQRQRGTLIDRAGCVKACGDASAALGKELEATVHRLAPLVFGAASVAKVRELLTAELNRARDNFADTLLALGADPRNGTRQ